MDPNDARPRTVATSSQEPDGPVVDLVAASIPGTPMAAGKVVLVLSGEPVEVHMTIPTGPVAVEDVLPIVQGLSNLIAVRATSRAVSEGRTISCRAGCGACCRQLVPVTVAEARAVARVVEAMPAERRAAVVSRFEAALSALEDTGVLDRLNDDVDDRRQVSHDYFRAGVACPLLEDEACSIHPDRPLACREYLVTSPPELCGDLSDGIEGVVLEARPSRALLDADLRGGWLPLVRALQIDAAEPPSPRERPGADILKDVIARL